MNSRITRRRFLADSATGFAGLVILPQSASARTYAANERLRLAHVGVGGRGGQLLTTFFQQESSVALCDVNEKRAAKAYGRFPKLPKFQDFREMLDKMDGQIDAVVVATPDHTHAVASAAAIRAGKHVYTEKPLTRTVRESRVLRELAKEHQVATSMGNQGTASHPFRRALELIRQGAIGRVEQVHAWNDQGGPDHQTAPAGESEIPAGLQWDLWLGPARQRPFHPQWLLWHGWRDFGAGNLGNWSSHTLNLPFMALDVASLWRAEAAARPVIRVQAEVNRINRISVPRWEMVHWEIPARGDLPPVSFRWHNGGGRPGMRAQLETLLGRGLDWGDKGEKKWADWAGCLIIGSEGKICANAHNTAFSMMPEAKFRNLRQDAPEQVDRSRGHERDWLLACRGGKPAWAHFDYAGPLTELNMLGNVATQFDVPLQYDPVAGKILGNDEADAALGGEYRQGWSL
ncbi:MAG: Gfo/Idh/MocA family oxidoreductase [Pirellulales bacterium]|nr:Gfo/Idh/MocA family oxidoreductase [Pirellulales bacterium]